MTSPETASVLNDVRLERSRQIDKGYTPEHDDGHARHEIVRYALARLVPKGYDVPLASIDRQALIEAAAVLVAAVEVIDRRVEP